MNKENTQAKNRKNNNQKPPKNINNKKGGSLYGRKQIEKSRRRGPARPEKGGEEFEQRIIDIARVTRVMAGGKRMRFRACVAIGNRTGKVGVGVDKGADVTIAVTKAVNEAKKNIVNVPIINDTIPHEIIQKLGAAKVMLKPARRGKGVIAGGAARIVLDLSGVKNITSKILGSNNKLNIAKCTLLALRNLKWVEPKKEKKEEEKKDSKKEKKVINKK
jgi:small subunit ribosomal protein S5